MRHIKSIEFPVWKAAEKSLNPAALVPYRLKFFTGKKNFSLPLRTREWRASKADRLQSSDGHSGSIDSGFFRCNGSGRAARRGRGNHALHPEPRVERAARSESVPQARNAATHRLIQVSRRLQPLGAAFARRAIARRS